jgi:two-component system response regulator AlgR
MLKILIIDDELPARSRLRRLLVAVPEVHVVGDAATGEEALNLIPVKEPDVLLLDISMPGLDGMSLARKLQEQKNSPAVIFCTAWSDKAVDAFECDAVDYLVKPVRKERLEKALDKARRFLTENSAQNAGFIRSVLGGKVSLFPLAEVICLNAEDKYTIVVHENGSIVINQSLLEFEEEHAELFIRVHRSTLVAKNRIRGLEKSTEGHVFLRLEGSDEHPQVSRRNLPAVRKLIRELS